MQIVPSQAQITFRTLHSKFQKKKSFSLNFFDFFLQIQATFFERIPKRYNTWGLVFSNPPSATPKTQPPATHPPTTQKMKYASRPQVLYIFGILSPNVT